MRRRPTALRRRKPVARLAPSIRRAVTKIAKRASHEETKHASATLENRVGHNSSIGNGDAVALIPAVPQGTDDFNRIGDKIAPTGLYIKGRLGLTYNQQANNRPISVRVMVVSQRTIRDATFLSAFTPNLLLSANDSTAGILDTNYDGSPRNALYPVNRNMFTVHYKRDFKMTPALDDGTQTGIESKGALSMVSWGCKVKLPKTLMYYNSSTDTPQNACPFLLIGYCYADGTAADVTTLRLTSTTVSTLYFKDA